MAGNRDLSASTKAQVIALLNTKKFSNRSIARQLGISAYSVIKIKQKVEAGENISAQRSGRCGRKRIITPRVERSVLRYCLRNRSATVQDIQSQLRAANVQVSRRTVHRTLSRINMKAHRPAKKPKLTERMKKKRYEWAKEHREKNLLFWRSVSAMV